MSLKRLRAGLLALLLLPGLVRAQSVPDTLLQARLERLVEGFRGDAGVYVRHLPTGRYAAIHADTLFPTASLIKVPILIKTFDAIERGELAYQQELVYRDSLRYPGVDLLGSFKDGEKIALSKMVMLMLTMSDNTASLWLQHLCGTGTAINAWLAAHGFEHTRVNSRTPGREAARERYGWGQTTPREIAELLVMIREGRAVSPAASEEMYRTLTRTYWDDEALSQLPPTVQAASKQGAVSRSRSEVALVNAPHGDYVFAVITKNQEDTSWDHDNEGFVLLRDVSRLLWEHFEPDTPWQPAPGSERYR
ncbi:class A beta-lactamase-related serine hydrolase [Rhodocaloribacter litoris]|uniref:serine hydrolase n=1 Tax=Rhodocaloribacter litoris TaxID=2558931 RepID=UPI00141E987E|nr:serine hydrolase [Rhodocaloribacter litoris]QXD14011.1 class A beta-lactamase-related serine hydrolase [Rhodocaloribacter litoris]